MHINKKKTYQLRKTQQRSIPTPQQNQRQIELIENQPIPVQDHKSRVKVQSPHYKPQISGTELIIDQLSILFHTKLGNINVKQLKVKNIGQSAVYFQWICKNVSKINANAAKDPKPKFYCHYENNVIKPGETISFALSFLSYIPGFFIQQWQLSCQPPLKTQIPLIKLEGHAYIQDQFNKSRISLLQQLQKQSLDRSIKQILEDVVNLVKQPQPPLPDINNLSIAENEFELKNYSKGLYYNPVVHSWFSELYRQICQKCNIPEENQYWNQSVQWLEQFIKKNTTLDQTTKLCYLDRLEHYYHLSTFKPLNKSQLFGTIKEYLFDAGYRLGGQYVDAARKQLDMWEVQFRQPLETDTQADLKSKEQEISKIKAQWLKKAKKKKWTEDDEKQLIKQYRNKLQHKTQGYIANLFSGFQEGAQYIKAKSTIAKTINLQSYIDFLSRLKTAKQFPLEGKKIFIKFNLKLKQNSQNKLQQLKQYIKLKKQEELRLQQQKKNQQQNSKKKKAPIKKKKGGKEEEQIKPITFDFMSLLDQQNWNGFIQTYKTILEKQPLLVLIGCTYGRKIGKYVQEFSVKFILDFLKGFDPAIQFLDHQRLNQIKQKIQNQNIVQGSVYLLQNLNFLAGEVMQEEVEVIINADNPDNVISKKTIQKLIFPQIKSKVSMFDPLIDVIVTEDRYADLPSGLISYLHKTNILGLQWWKYISLCLRAKNSSMIVGGDLNPQKIIFLTRALEWAKKIYLTGLLGVKFWIAKRQLKQNLQHKYQGGDKIWHGVTVKNVQVQAIRYLLNGALQKNYSQKIEVPQDFIFSKQLQGKLQKINYDQNQQQLPQDHKIIDLGPKTINQIEQISSGYLYLFDLPSLHSMEYYKQIDHQSSFELLMKLIYKKQQQKRNRHKMELSTTGINYQKDIICILIGIESKYIESLTLKQPKVKERQQGEQPEVQQQQEILEEETRKIDLIADFQLQSLKCIQKIIIGEFIVGLRDIERYQKSDD